MADDLDVVPHPTLGPLRFPKSMGPDERNAIIDRMTAQNAAPRMADGTFNPMHPLDNIKSNLPSLVDVGKGMLKGALHTVSGADDFVQRYAPALNTPLLGGGTSAQAVQYAKDLAVPHNDAQSMGRNIEQAAEFMVPGDAEKALIGKGASLGARVLASAGGAGIVNKAQGGSFLGGAAAGGLGAAAAAAIAKMAAPIAGKAMNLKAVDRALGRDPAQAILDETTGVRPKTVADQATAKLNQYGNELNGNADASVTPVSMAPPRDTAFDHLIKANSQSERAGYNEVEGLNTQLYQRPDGTAIPDSLPARDALEMKRGVDAYKGSWNPTIKHTLADNAVSAVHASMQPGLEAAIPGYADLNSKLSSLMPVASRAGATDLNENLVARTLSRFGAKTGALAPALAGFGAGGAIGHSPAAAMLGGAMGLLGPEIMASPTTLMTAARLAASPTLPKLVRPLVGAGAQLTRDGVNQ